jgi:transposase
MFGVPGVRFSETHALAAPRALLTSRAVSWATDALADDDTTVSALDRRLGVDWYALWGAGKAGGAAPRRRPRPPRRGHRARRR